MTSKRRLLEVSRTILAILIALGIALIAVFSVSKNPGEALGYFLVGPLNSLRHVGNVVELMIPLTFTGLAVAVMFSARQFNLGAEGGFFIGAIVATAIAIKLPLPPVLHPIVAIVAGGVAGMLFCGLPGFLRVKWGSSELVSSLMFNYIAFFFGLWIINYHLRDVNAGAMVSYTFAPSAQLPKLVPGTRVSVGFLVAAAFVVIMVLFMYKTRWGYQIRVTGVNSSFAKYSGIRTGSVVIFSQLLGGLLAGVGGSIETLGMYTRFSWQTLPGYGWDGVIVAILARNNPLYVPVAAFFLSYLRIGADLMSRYSDVPNELVAIIQGVMIILIAASSFLDKYRHRLVYEEATRLEAHVAGGTMSASGTTSAGGAAGATGAETGRQ